MITAGLFALAANCKASIVFPHPAGPTSLIFAEGLPAAKSLRDNFSIPFKYSFNFGLKEKYGSIAGTGTTATGATFATTGATTGATATGASNSASFGTS